LPHSISKQGRKTARKVVAAPDAAARAIIVVSRYAIPSLDQTDEVFGTHN
jgi:hypothetical protein